MNVEDMEYFGHLEQGKEYIVNIEDEDSYATHIKVIFKGQKTILIEKIDPNEKETIKEWYIMGEDSDELKEVYEELTEFNRENKLTELLDEAKN